ncbi:MAG: GMC family oxidoreductase [Phototrophicaceae bacterium]
MSLWNEKEKQAMGAICEALVAPQASAQDSLSQWTADDSNLLERLEEAYSKIASEEEQQDLKLLLNSFENSSFNGLMGGIWKPLSKMSIHERESILQSWANSRFELRRKAFQGIKRLALFLAYSNQPEREKHPAWDVLDYPGPSSGGDEAKHIIPYEITDNRTLTCDVLVIGSGAGGGVVAGELSEAGYDVMVVEKGNYYAEEDFTGNEREASETMFEKYGSLTTHDTAMVILAGKVLGGGTTVNWNASFRTPDNVLSEWANTYGLSDANTQVWQDSLDAVYTRSNVSCDESHLNGNNAMLERGLVKLGYHMDTIPRNVKGCEECGFCNYGCSFGAKQGTLKTYLQDAYDRGSRIVVQSTVKRVMHENGKVTGAIVEAIDANDTIHLITIRAKIVVVSAGAIHTPAILKRSGLENPNIGEHLHLHPTSLIFSLFDEAIIPWQGVPMSRVSKEFSNLDGQGYGFAIESAPAHPGLTAATIPWLNAKAHKNFMRHMNKMANVLAITRDYHGGSIKLDKYGEPQIHYKLHDYDKRHLQRGILEAAKVHFAAGAKEIYAPHATSYTYTNDGNEANFVRWLRQVEDAGLEPNAFPLFSAHQMSSARMAASSQQGACKPTGETWEIDNLFVADASSMPTSTGVNPMISIMGTAHYISQHIKAKLG